LAPDLLSPDDPEEARDLAEQLDALNISRKDVERTVLEEPSVSSTERRAPMRPSWIAAGEGWRPGVVGIVAGRLRERYRRPVVVIGLDSVSGIGKGSAAHSLV
jgi:single-stranded-DNA-specific exonuclease